MESMSVEARTVEVQNLIQQIGCDTNGETNKERRDQMRHLQKEAFQLANYYFVFQGVIFTAFYNMPSDLKCKYHWIPFTLSLLAGSLNLCALTTIALKYKMILDDIDKTAMRCAPRANQAVAGSGNGNNNNNEPIAVKCARHWRLFYVVVCMGLFIGFFVITLIGCWKITCGGQSLSAAVPLSPPA
ncbi:hypothetical protein BUALT_Bualt10G0105600 [Buddleja alternifolia]|uniref:Uncharacterized protein n=1 Tax=Buddleja alternifolia TaxID=168488 RepID=A0AAV6WYT7_9LAMI|nr:hypothetical protein BUALT_Bualt10G0105600 [Buddleja alternifolia]